MNIKLELKEIRRNLFHSLDDAKTPKELCQFQKRLAVAIQNAEQRKAQAQDKSEKELYSIHNRMCRSYGDALAWRLLSPHTIRQLNSVEQHPPPNLSGMKEVIERYLFIVEQLANLGYVALVSDLTNLIKIADVIVPTQSEIPLLLEFKGERIYTVSNWLLEKGAKLVPEEDLTGRLGRQMEKLMEVSRYLATGRRETHDGTKELRAVPVNTQVEYYWDEINRAVSDALENMDCVVKISNQQWIYATQREPEDLDPLSTMSQMIKEMPREAHLRIGCHLVPLENPQWYFDPPINWLLEKRIKFALMEGDISLFNFIDLSFLKGYSYKGAVIIQIGAYDPELGNDVVYVKYRNQTTKVSKNFILGMLYKFQTLESAVEEILESVISSHGNVEAA